MTALLLTWLTVIGAASPALEAASAALDDFRPDDALAVLADVPGTTPLTWGENVRLHELSAIAHAYLDHEQASRAAFAKLLALDPSHVISYTLNPKVTFVFQEARRSAGTRRPPQVQLGWTRGRPAGSTLPVTVETIADPAAHFSTAILRARRKGSKQLREITLKLPPVGDYLELNLEPFPANAEDQVIELSLVVRDAAGNEVLHVGRPHEPFEVTMRYVEPVRWHQRWWVWAVAGTVVAAAAGGTVYLLTRKPPSKVTGRIN